MRSDFEVYKRQHEFFHGLYIRQLRIPSIIANDTVDHSKTMVLEIDAARTKNHWRHIREYLSEFEPGGNL